MFHYVKLRRSNWRWAFGQSEFTGFAALFPVFGCRDETVGSFGRRVRVGPVSGVCENDTDWSAECGHVRVRLDCVHHRCELLRVVVVLGDGGCDDDLTGVDGGLGVEALNPTSRCFHDPALRICGVGLQLGHRYRGRGEACLVCELFGDRDLVGCASP